MFFTEEEREWLLADAREKEKERESISGSAGAGASGSGNGSGGGGVEQRIKEAAKAKADLVYITLLRPTYLPYPDYFISLFRCLFYIAVYSILPLTLIQEEPLLTPL